MFNNFINDGGYTGIGDKTFKRETFILKDLPTSDAKIEFRMLDDNEANDLQSEGIENVIPARFIDIWTRLEAFLGLKLSGHTFTLLDSSNLKDELF